MNSNTTKTGMYITKPIQNCNVVFTKLLNQIMPSECSFYNELPFEGH